MEIVRAVLVLALAVGVAVLVLTLAVYMWPPIKPYGDVLPYITVKNTSKGIQLGVFDYSNIKPKAAYIYVNGRLAGSTSGEGWSNVYVKCGDYVEALFQYDGFNRKVEGRIGCSKPLLHVVTEQVVWTSRNALEVMTALDTLGVDITANCGNPYPVFTIVNKGALWIEYAPTNGYRYASKSAVNVPFYSAGVLNGTLRAYKMPPYGYTVADFVATRLVKLDFVVTEKRVDNPDGTYDMIYTGYAVIEGEPNKLAECVYHYATVLKIDKITFTSWDRVDPEMLYEFDVWDHETGSTIRYTVAVYPNESAIRVTATNLGPVPNGSTTNQALVLPLDNQTKIYLARYTDINEAQKAFDIINRVAMKKGISTAAVAEEVIRTLRTLPAIDKTYGDVPAIFKNEESVYYSYKTILLGKQFKSGGVTIEGGWLAVPGVFRGLSAGGWDLFANYIQKVYANVTAAPPYVFTVG